MDSENKKATVADFVKLSIDEMKSGIAINDTPVPLTTNEVPVGCKLSPTFDDKYFKPGTFVKVKYILSHTTIEGNGIIEKTEPTRMWVSVYVNASRGLRRFEYTPEEYVNGTLELEKVADEPDAGHSNLVICE
jgi:hypothetical protein